MALQLRHSRKHVQMVDLELGDLLVDPLRINQVKNTVHKLVLVVLADVVLDVLQNVQDALHVFLHQFWTK